jgi:microcompartment protein CcmL/EutN
MNAQEIGYEAAPAPRLRLVQMVQGDIQATRESLHAMAIEAMRGTRTMLLHVEHRIGGDVVAPCPVAEAFAEVMGHHDVHHALLDLLRDCKSLQADSLRTAIATRYAERNAPRIAALGGV